MRAKIHPFSKHLMITLLALTVFMLVPLRAQAGNEYLQKFDNFHHPVVDLR